MRVRTYVLSAQGLRRMPTAVWLGEVAIPQFANSRLKYIRAEHEWRDDALWLAIRGHFLDFDDFGKSYVPDRALANAVRLVEAHAAIDRQRRDTPGVLDAAPYRQVRLLRAESDWHPTDSEFKAIAADLLGSRRPKGTGPIPFLRDEPPASSEQTI